MPPPHRPFTRPHSAKMKLFIQGPGARPLPPAAPAALRPPAPAATPAASDAAPRLEPVPASHQQHEAPTAAAQAPKRRKQEAPPAPKPAPPAAVSSSEAHDQPQRGRRNRGRPSKFMSNLLTGLIGFGPVLQLFKKVFLVLGPTLNSLVGNTQLAVGNKLLDFFAPGFSLGGSGTQNLASEIAVLPSLLRQLIVFLR